MKYTLAFILLIPAITIGSAAHAGPCDHTWQTASDGSSCGDRAADVRPGGR